MNALLVYLMAFFAVAPPQKQVDPQRSHEQAARTDRDEGTVWWVVIDISNGF